MKYTFFIIISVLLACTNEPKTIAKNQSAESPVTPTTIAQHTQKDTIPIISKAKQKTQNKPQKTILQANSKWPIPQELEYEHLVPSTYCQTKYLCIKNKYFPIAWSASGLLAYLVERPPVNIGTTFTLFIQDMDSDKVIFKKRWEEEATSIKELWKLKQIEIVKALENNGLKRSSNVHALKALPFTTRGNAYRFFIEAIPANRQIPFEEKVFVKATNLGSKQVYKNSYIHVFGITEQSKIIGVLKSPFEKRIAILKLNDVYQFEGDKELSIEFIGCDLVNDYSKKQGSKFN